MRKPMKKLYVLISILLLALQTFAQFTEFNWDTITFETENLYIDIDTSSQNIWQIGTPSKTFFDSAFSANNAIVTDTLNNYPINNHSYFDLRLGYFNCPDYISHSTFFEIKHKFDTDTLKDGGYISVSHDNGQSWSNIINDTSYLHCESPNANNMFVEELYSPTDTLFNGEFGFSGNSNGWINTRFSWFDWPVKNVQYVGDTIIIRFHFISDDIETNQEGWMIDNIRLYAVDLGDKIETQNIVDFEIFPNPMLDKSTIQLSNYQNTTICMYDMQGRKVQQTNFCNNQPIVLNKNKLKAGLYFVKIISDNNQLGIQKLLIR